MDFFQELVLTAFLAFVFSLAIMKFVSLAFSNSSDDGKTAIFSVEEAKLVNGLKVGRTKSKKRVKFAGDVVIKKIDQYQGEKGFENLGLCLDESVGEVIVKEKSEDEKIAKMVDQFEGEEELNRDSEIKISGMMQDTVDEDKRSKYIGMLIEKTDEGHEIREICSEISREKKNGEELKNRDVETDEGHEIGEICGEKEDTLVSGGLDGVIFRAKKNGEELENHDVETDQKEGNGNGGLGGNDELMKGDVEDENFDDEDDDWEGIERSDLDKVFAEAVNYVEYGGKGKGKDNDRLAKLLSNVQMQLYGLHKVAVEGPCHEPQPMALKVSSRAKWNAWQSLGSMNQEAAMEQYIKILSDIVPGWMQNYSADDDMQGSGTPSNSNSQLREDERKEELNSVTDKGDPGMGANSTEKEKNGKDQVSP
ncbi:acyl-CoA-binding domain-containing protein 3-like isoform X1 [Olea europaea var. sylvestris]|uniref:acyl-CoA-binding domain-containing protein 3-like isoform X1 n=1 Tax=Olea europaea var. sylvestris TaxID=158386 RepID=UPI000C1D555F|nr:acyl-CoA-binding domain-containing protein 3-like isoform X1 [Olea europaea var. sylvestris]